MYWGPKLHWPIMTDITDRRLVHLPPAAGKLGHVLGRPKVLAAACVVALTTLGWLYLGLAATGEGAPHGIGVLCGPLPRAGIGISGLAFALCMWIAMAFAMMLPSAGPMIFTYAEIADTAACKGEAIVSPFVLAAGYALVWIVFSLVATILQTGLTQVGALNDNTAMTSTVLSGAVLVAAGFYQFSAFKHACLHKCRHPFPFFFANWQTTPAGVFRLGVVQGLYCLGCCWAMMSVMFAVGAMNLIWMAALGTAMTVEKMLTGRRFSHALGLSLLGAGAIVVVLALQQG